MELSATIDSLIGNLNLTSFPCGPGNWRNEKLKEYDIQMHEHSVGQEESVSVLQSYCEGLKTPWHVDCDWSDEAHILRDLSVTSPKMFEDPDMIYKHFKTLYIRGRKVTSVDKGLLKFINLHELILSVNSLTDVEGKNLPRGLQVLELCGNSISDLYSLSRRAPPGLLNLGLSYNTIPNIQCLEPNQWLHLLSLDLSYNHITSLSETMNVLSKLPKLRTLSLMGNPLALVAAYRPYVISVVPQLTYFDEVQILSDDHTFCKNFSLSLEEEDLMFVSLTVSLLSVSGIPCPTEQDISQNGMLARKVDYTYYVDYDFLPDKLAEGTELQDSCFESEALPWSEEISLNYSKEHKSSLLQRCRDHITQGLTFRIMELQVMSLPPTNEQENEPLQPDSGKKSKQKSSLSTREAPTPVGKKDKEKGGKGDKEKKGKEGKAKSKGGLDVTAGWVKQPPERRCLAETRMVLSELLTGHNKTSIDQGLEVELPLCNQQKEVEEGEQTDGKDSAESVNSGEDKKPSYTVTLAVRVELKRHPLTHKLH